VQHISGAPLTGGLLERLRDKRSGLLWQFVSYSRKRFYNIGPIVNFLNISSNSSFEVNNVFPGNTKGGSIIVPFTSCLTGLDWSVLQIKTKIVSCHTADSKPVNQEVNSTVILPPLVFPGFSLQFIPSSAVEIVADT